MLGLAPPWWFAYCSGMPLHESACYRRFVGILRSSLPQKGEHKRIMRIVAKYFWILFFRTLYSLASPTATCTQMSALVIGATGGLGKAIVREALSVGMKVSVLVRSKDKLNEELADVVKDITNVFTGDATDARLVREAVEGHDVVFGVCLLCDVPFRSLHRSFLYNVVPRS